MSCVSSPPSLGRHPHGGTRIHFGAAYATARFSEHTFGESEEQLRPYFSQEVGRGWGFMRAVFA